MKVLYFEAHVEVHRIVTAGDPPAISRDLTDFAKREGWWWSTFSDDEDGKLTDSVFWTKRFEMKQSEARYTTAQEEALAVAREGVLFFCGYVQGAGLAVKRTKIEAAVFDTKEKGATA